MFDPGKYDYPIYIPHAVPEDEPDLEDNVNDTEEYPTQATPDDEW